MLSKLKRLAEAIPEPVGRHLVWVPFSWRLGRQYGSARRTITRYEQWSTSQRKDFIFRHVRAIVEHACANNEFYRCFYSDQGFSPSQLRGFDDIERIPIVRKADLRAWETDRRSTPMPGAFRVNTGGTSGEPLEFYLSGRLFAHEWAHMHAAWERLGYQQTDSKLTFRGKSLGDCVLKFNAVHNEFVVSAYHSQREIAEEIRSLLRRRTIRYLHGYPSTIYEFAIHCATEATDVRDSLRRSLRGVLLGSEFPIPSYREMIESTFEVSSLSWYGHSEMAILAFEKVKPFLYSPMHTYGYAEAIPQGNGTARLVGTAYHNTGSPFIRYDTGDIVQSHIDSGVLESFRIAAGRTGDYIVDRRKQRISLTAFIFGRHHEAFGAADFVQVRQVEPGHATIVVVPRRQHEPGLDWGSLFDLNGVEMNFDFEIADAPYRTASGKAPLLLRAQYVNNTPLRLFADNRHETDSPARPAWAAHTR